MSRISEHFYINYIKPILFKMKPDQAHNVIISMMNKAGHVHALRGLAKALYGKKYKELETSLEGIKFDSPVGLSAGLDKNGQIVPIISALGFGFSEVGSVTAEPCIGNPRPWFHRLPNSQSLVVHAGLANEGVVQVLKNVNRGKAFIPKGFPIILSVAKNNSPDVVSCQEGIADYLESIKLAQKDPLIKMIEINISCPNAYGGEQFTNVETFTKLVKAISKLKVEKPLIVKMPSSLEFSVFKQLIDVALAHDIKIFAISNLLKDRSLITKDELPDHIKGGLSGKPLQQLSDQLIERTYKEFGEKVIIIGIGGIFTAKDAYQKIKLGASYVELITGMIYGGPQVVAQINKDLVKLLAADGYKNIKEAVGKGVK